MRCPQCQHENRAGARFCEACGRKLELSCPACDHLPRPGAAFCESCGTPLTRQPEVRSAERGVQPPQSPLSYTPPHLAERIRAEQAAMDARGATEGERKTITILFADIKGSMALLEDLDPEDARRLIDPALQLMIDAVHHCEGYVAQSTGDGIFALFGAPLAHEDHPQRAVYAALRMQEEIRRYGDQLRQAGQAPLEIRVGVNTGDVVVRSIRTEDLHTDYVPIGHSTGLAARLESLARAGSIVVSEHTYELTRGYFEFTALGLTQVKGVTEPLDLYEVRGVGPLRTRLQVAASRGLVRFVGRQSELERLTQAWELTQAGHGQVVAVVGEPGVGKSRLFYEFKLLVQRGCLVLETFAVAHSKVSPYLPLPELLKHYFQITLPDDERRRREKVTGKVLTLDRALEDTLPYLFAVLGIAEAHAPLPQMDAQVRRRRTFEALKRVLVRESLTQPLVLICEDLQWVDSETEAFLTFLSESVATARILLLVNYRPEYRHEWDTKTSYTQVRLAPLGPAEAQELLTALLGDGTELNPLKQLILAKTEGNPFFMEEIVQELCEQGVVVREPAGGVKLAVPSPGRTRPAPTDLRIPPTVQAVLAARIDRLLPSEKELLQTLAVIGREFASRLLTQVVDQPEEALHRRLSHLQAAEFIYEQPAFPEMVYTFKHALTQEVAYTSLLQERRRVVHERTAQAIEALYPSKLYDHYGELARHYRRSGNTAKAVEYLQRAGEQAVQRSAHADAIMHLTTAVELLRTLPDTRERAHHELALHLALGPPLFATKGYAAPEVEHAYSRALELCRQVGESAQLFPVLGGLWQIYSVRAEFPKARELAEQLLTLAQGVQDSALLLVAHDALGQICFYLGEFARARTYFEHSLALYDPQHHHLLAFLVGGEDPGVACRGYAALTLWLLGYPAQALQRMHEALTLAQELNSPYDLAWALYTVGQFHHVCREGPAVQEQVEALLALSSEQGFAYWWATGTILRGWALATQERGKEGIREIRQGLDTYRATGAEGGRPYFLALLAEAYGKVEQFDEGLNALTEALATVNRTGERYYEAELYRLKGQLTLAQSSVPRLASGVQTPQSAFRNPQSEAEACFLKAIEIAQRQQAKSWELRAGISLARLWQSQGKRDDARRRLAEIYGWFTEGFDTADLVEARALLEELS